MESIRMSQAGMPNRPVPAGGRNRGKLSIRADGARRGGSPAPGKPD
jgi:hypothetical protein